MLKLTRAVFASERPPSDGERLATFHARFDLLPEARRNPTSNPLERTLIALRAKRAEREHQPPPEFALTPPRDIPAIETAVRRYAQRIGCNDSNTRVAIAWALRHGSNTVTAIREGRQRAVVLCARQRTFTAPQPA